MIALILANCPAMSFVFVYWHGSSDPLYAELCKWHSYGQTRSTGQYILQKGHLSYKKKRVQEQRTGRKMGQNPKKNYAELYGGALVWTTVFINLFILSELTYKSFEWPCFFWLIDWKNETYISWLKISWFKLVCLSISRLKYVWDIWF